jgi:hypothetical protein
MSLNEHSFPYGSATGAALHRASSQVRIYPFQKILMTTGGLVGFGVSIMFGDFLMGVILFVGFACAGLTWRRAEVPIFTFCVLYQWLFIGAGYFYLKIVGVYPGIRFLGDLDTAVIYSLAGLLCVVLGIRGALRSYHFGWNSQDNNYDASKLFWIVLALFSVNWFMELSAVQLRLAAFNIAQPLHHMLILRYLFLYLLLLTVLQQGRQYLLGLLAFAYVLLPELTSRMTKFKELFFLFVVVLMSQWRPFATLKSDQSRNRIIVATVFSVSAFLLVVGLIWSGGMKHDWRTALSTGQVTGSPIDKIEAYGQHAVSSIESFNINRATETLASRLSSGVAYFSHVLRVVPKIVPHEDGGLSWRALRHVLMPRVLFPEKPDLGGDSWLVRKYALLNVSGNKSGTSIGLGYMAEFFIDFGFPGMLVPLFFYGVLLGLMYRALSAMCPSSHVFAAVTAGLFLQHFLSYEGNFTKLLGGIVQNFLILMVFLGALGSKAHGFLTTRTKTNKGHSAHPDGPTRSR